VGLDPKSSACSNRLQNMCCNTWLERLPRACTGVFAPSATDRPCGCNEGFQRPIKEEMINVIIIRGGRDTAVDSEYRTW